MPRPNRDNWEQLFWLAIAIAGLVITAFFVLRIIAYVMAETPS